MPIYKALILNKEINVNYEENQKEKLVNAVSSINNKLNNLNDTNGKINDNKLLSFLAIKLQAEIHELNLKNKNDTDLEKKLKEVNNKNIHLNDKIIKLSEKNNLLEEESTKLNSEIKIIQNQIDIILKLLKNVYE